MADIPMVTIGYFFDQNPTRPAFAERTNFSAYERFQMYLAEFDWRPYQTVVIDSLTNFCRAVVRLNQYKINRVAKSGSVQDGRQWHGAAWLAVQNEIMDTVCYYMTNVVCVAHITKDKDDMRGHYVYGRDLPGKLSNGISRNFSEDYYVHVREGRVVFQTQASEDYLAQTHIRASNYCPPRYEALWTRQSNEHRPITKTLLYGDPGVGKSTAAATWPKPMFVWFFDPPGKDLAYLEQGEPQGVILAADGTPFQHVLQREGS